MKSRWRFWVELFARRERGTSLAALRIGVGCAALYSLLSVAAAGLVEPLWLDQAHGGMQRAHPTWLLELLGVATPGVIWSLFWIAVGTAVCVIVGLGGRVATFVLLQVYAALVASNPNTSGGGDLLITNALWLLTLGWSTASLSLDCRMRTGRWWSDRLVSAWPRYLFVFQLVVVYFAAGAQKTSVHWTPGGGYLALHYVLQEPTWIRWDPAWFETLSPLTRIGTAITWHWEQLAPLLLLVYYYRYTRERAGRLRRLFNRRDLRKPWAAIGLGLHVGILLVINVGPFSVISMAYYLALWTPDELEAGAARVWRKLWRR
jgi:hypothetical protein